MELEDGKEWKRKGRKWTTTTKRGWREEKGEKENGKDKGDDKGEKDDGRDNSRHDRREGRKRTRGTNGDRRDEKTSAE